MGSRLSGLLLASHPAPTAAVTTLGTVLFVSAGNPVRTCLIGALALLTGQLSIGWSNDLIDRRRDRQAGRADKPLATGTLTAALLRRACLLAVLLTVPASLGLGVRAGLLHLAAVSAGWAYNLGLKSRPVSPLPYLLAFGALPAVATLALPTPRWPPAWIVLAAALIGAAAHFANVLPDLDDDLAAGVRGLPQRLGLAPAAVLAALLTLLATGLVLPHAGPAIATAVLLVVLGLVGYGLYACLLRGRPAVAFGSIMASAACAVGLLAGSGVLGRG
jgi:4-hydroxybenzoate polyprenyltransferase